MPSNYEHYKKEIAKEVSCTFRKAFFLKSHSCDEVFSCKECNEKFLDWLNEQYVPEPSDGVKWDKVPKDTPVLVWEKDEKELIPHAKKRFFAKYMPESPDGKFAVYANGSNSWSHEGKYEKWTYCSLLRVEDMEKYIKSE